MELVNKNYKIYKIAMIAVFLIAVVSLALVAGVGNVSNTIAKAEVYTGDKGFGVWRGYTEYDDFGSYLTVSIDDDYVVSFASNTSFQNYTSDYDIEILICSGDVGSYLFQPNRSLIYSGTDKFGTMPTKSYSIKNNLISSGCAYGTYSIGVVLYNNITNKYMKGYPDTTVFVIPRPTVDLPDDPVKVGHTFVGWYYDSSLTIPYVDGDPIYEDTTLYAKFDINTYSVFIRGFDNASIESGTYDYNSSLNISAPNLFGYTFTGWYTDDSRTNLYSTDVSLNITVNEDITLYAGYEVVTVTVTFIVDGVVYTTLEVPYGATLISTEEGEAVLANLSFISKSPLMLSAFDVENEIINEDITLFAQFADTDDNAINFIKGNWRMLTCAAAVIILTAVLVAVIKKALKNNKKKRI